MPIKRPLSPLPREKDIRITRMVWGTPMIKSISQLINASRAFEPVADIIPTMTAMTAHCL